MHPLESGCVVPLLLYFIAIPCMYMILPIYSICNLNVVSWGTRENPRIDDPSIATGLKAKNNRRKAGGRNWDPVGHDYESNEVSVRC
jgi:chitin synthase